MPKDLPPIPTTLAVLMLILFTISSIILFRRSRNRAVAQERELEERWDKLASARPVSITEALVAMRALLEFLHETSDHRAVFLRAYYIITRNVSRAIEMQSNGGQLVFFEPNWVSLLSGRFASLYFRSLPPRRVAAPSPVKAWVAAHGEKPSGTIGVTHELLLGINAHINFDLPWALKQNLEASGDHRSYIDMMRRKFDHDQVNGILLQSLPEIKYVMARDYGGATRLLARLMLTFDNAAVGAGLAYYRERVWWNAVSLLATKDESEQTIMNDRLTWEVDLVATRILREDGLLPNLLLRFERAVRRRVLREISID